MEAASIYSKPSTPTRAVSPTASQNGLSRSHWRSNWEDQHKTVGFPNAPVDSVPVGPSPASHSPPVETPRTAGLLCECLPKENTPTPFSRAPRGVSTDRDINRAALGPLCKGATGLGEVRESLYLVVERLGALERRLEWWNTQQESRLDHILHSRPRVTLRPKKHVSKIGRVRELARSNSGGSVNTTAFTPREPEPGPGEEAHGRNGLAWQFGTVALPRETSKTSGTSAEHGPRRRDNSALTGGSGNTESRKSHVNPMLQHELVELGKARTSTKPQRKGSDSNIQALKRSRTREEGGTIFELVTNPVFDSFFGVVIILNAVFIAIQTEYMMQHALSGQLDQGTPHVAFSAADKVFAAIFSLELGLRIAGLKKKFFWCTEAGFCWNLFDLILVCVSIMELVLEIAGFDNTAAGDAFGGKVMRMFRMARIARVIRIMRFLDELRTMVMLILNSMRSLFWLMVLLGMILFVFAIFFTQGVADYLEGNAMHEKLRLHYGGLANSIFTLFMAITGGVSWIDVVDPLSGVSGGLFTALFILYVSFCVFSVLNIVTGVFVDGAIQRSAHERDRKLEKEKEQKEVYIRILMDLLLEISGGDPDGPISRECLQEAFNKDHVKNTFAALELDIHDSNYLFDMLDLDRSGSVDMDEFVMGCLRLKGNAKSIDIHTLMFEIRHLMKRIEFVFAEDAGDT